MSINVALVLAQVSDRLQSAGIDTHRVDARNLMSIATGIPANHFLIQSDQSLTDDELQALESFVQRRLLGEPVSRIRGSREFWGLSFQLSPDTLDPRPDSETIVSTVLAHCAQQDISKAYSILDLGTGTGCLLLSLLSELQNAVGVGVDISENAVRTAQSNARRLELSDRSTFVVGDWASSLKNPFDIVVCNPPYIRKGNIEILSPEVRDFDPNLALDGGTDGLDCFRSLIPGIVNLLSHYGILVFEIGYDQEQAVSALLGKSRFRGIQGHQDLAGHVRCLSFSPN